jgi:dTDP-4-dehydrorhamnose reductase
MKQKIIIATIKSWNIKNAYKFKELYKDKYKVIILTNKEKFTENTIAKFNPEWIFYPHWSWLIPPKIYNKYNYVLFHITDLPFGRGGSPLQNLIFRKIYTTKISAIKVVKEIDAGSVYLKENFSIKNGSAGEIFNKASKILVTGASGMLGACLVKFWSNKYNVFATSRSNFSDNTAKNYKIFDLKSENYGELIKWAKPDIIVHCAAITNVDYCEENPEEAMIINGESVRKLIDSAPNAKLIFISTDAVFPCQTHLVTENIRTGPKNIYGKSKEYGENFIKNSLKNNCIVRTTIIGKNINTYKQGFVDWIINSIKKGKSITLFDDVFFTPISIWHLADELEWIINNHVPKILHISGSEITTKYEFVYRLCKKMGLDTSLIKSGSINDAKFKAERAKDQTLDSSLYISLSKHKLPNLEENIEILMKYFGGYYERN